jgi:hypothetical protein
LVLSLGLAVVEHLLLVRVGAVAVAVVLADMLVRVLKVTHHLPLREQVMPQQLVVVVLLELAMVATAQQVVHRKVVAVVLMEPQIWVATVVLVEQAVEAAQVVVRQQLLSTLAQVVMAEMHRSRYGCSDEMARIERRWCCRKHFYLGWCHTVFTRRCCTTFTVCR